MVVQIPAPFLIFFVVVTVACWGALMFFAVTAPRAKASAPSEAPALSPLAERLLGVFSDDDRAWEVTFAGSLRCGTLLANGRGAVMVHSTYLSDGLTDSERKQVSAAVRRRIRLVSYDERCESLDSWLASDNVPHAAYHIGDD